MSLKGKKSNYDNDDSNGENDCDGDDSGEQKLKLIYISRSKM